MIKDGYEGREQAQHKHDILRSYISQLFLIIGKSKVTRINYVDCFSGPWQEADSSLSGTSIAISVQQMQLCVNWMKKHLNKNIEFRGLYIEKDPTSFDKLKSYTEKQSNGSITLDALNGEFAELIPEILQWSGAEFTFYFIDPKGWTDVAPDILSPLFKRENSEFLINFMYAFQNRMLTVDLFKEDQNRVFCGRSDEIDQSNAETREADAVRIYNECLKECFNGYTYYFPIERPGQTRTLYYLFYLTRHPKGIKVFADAGETQMLAQAKMHNHQKLQKQFEVAEECVVNDLFSDQTFDAPIADFERKREESINLAYLYLTRRFETERSIKFDYELWARILEETRLMPSDFHEAMKKLYREGSVQCQPKLKRIRPKYMIHPNWPNRAETWNFLK